MKQLKAHLNYDTACEIIRQLDPDIIFKEHPKYFICPYCHNVITQQEHEFLEAEIFPDQKFQISPFCPICGTFFE